MNNEKKSFIPEEKIFKQLEETKNPSKKQIEQVLSKAMELKGLSPQDTAVLINAQKMPEIDELIFQNARKVKENIYGNRMVLFAPLYVTNECGNNCSYCGFRASNPELIRKTLSDEELIREVEILEDQGHKRILLVYGEHPKFHADWLAHTVEVVYKVKKGHGDIRRVNINSAPMSVEDFKVIKSTGIGTYQCFQETYHQKTYSEVHTGGKKKDYLWRLYAQDRAQEGGIDDVALGVLFGLFDWKFELMALLYHALHLEEQFGVGPHTISFPRIEPALGAPISYKPPYTVSDEDFRRIVAVLRLAVPYTGLILSTRENSQMREEVFGLGVSQISAGSRTYPGGYNDMASNMPDKQQFTIGDDRPLDEVIRDLALGGYIPSFCTSCYRSGRTGQHFMELAKPGFIKKFCQPNAILTFMEYLQDYASDKTKQAGMNLINSEMDKMDNKEIAKSVEKRLEQIKNGQRDLYY